MNSHVWQAAYGSWGERQYRLFRTKAEAKDYLRAFLECQECPNSIIRYDRAEYSDAWSRCNDRARKDSFRIERERNELC